jgi:plasmid stability protein
MCNDHRMPIMIQVRNVPERLHRELKRRAKLHGETLTDYIQGILEREVARPDRRDVLARILRREPVDLGGITAAELVREARRDADRE